MIELDSDVIFTTNPSKIVITRKKPFNFFQVYQFLFVERVDVNFWNNNKLFIDTDMYVMKVWAEYVFNNCHPYILEQINQRQYDFYLLCNIDLPWAPDEMREYPDEKPRQELFSIYKDILINQHTPWGIVNGKAEERTENAIQLIDQFFE